MTIVSTRSGPIWVGTFGGGANIVDPATGQVRQLPHGTARRGAISASIVTSIAEDASGYVWIGTDGGGLNLARADGTVVKVFRHDPKDARRCTVAGQLDLLARDGCRRAGLGRHQWRRARARRGFGGHRRTTFASSCVSRADGLSNDTVYGIVPDASGNLWISGNAGLVRLDPKTRDIKTVSSRARAAGRGVRVRRVLTGCATAASRSAGRAASTFSIRRG